jgi:hypothetical protein
MASEFHEIFTAKHAKKSRKDREAITINLFLCGLCEFFAVKVFCLDEAKRSLRLTLTICETES